MALVAGTITVTIEFAKDLKDCDLIGRQDPYVILKCGQSTFRTKTDKCGGTSPVWNETFKINVLHENTLELELKDEDLIGKDDIIGYAYLDLTKARERGYYQVQVPVVRPKSRKQHGYVSVRLEFTGHAGK